MTVDPVKLSCSSRGSTRDVEVSSPHPPQCPAPPPVPLLAAVARSSYSATWSCWASGTTRARSCRPLRSSLRTVRPCFRVSCVFMWSDGRVHGRKVLNSAPPLALFAALDATQLSAMSESWDTAPPEMLRVHVRGDVDSGLVDIVCADTGSGIRTHQLTQLCCGMFETTKGGTAGRRGGAPTSGKYGWSPSELGVWECICMVDLRTRFLKRNLCVCSAQALA